MHLITQSEMGVLAGVTANTVSRALRDERALKAAAHGTKVNIEHPDAIHWIEERIGHHFQEGFYTSRVDAQNGRKRKIKQYFDEQTESERHRAKLDELAKDIRALADMSLSDLIRYFGDDIRFLDWLKSLREIEDVEAKRLKNAESRGTLVKREIIHVGIFMVLDAAFRGLLTDGSKSISSKVTTMVKAGVEAKEIEDFIRDVMGQYLNNARNKMQRCLNGL